MDSKNVEREASILASKVRVSAGLYKTALQTNVGVAECRGNFQKAAQELEGFIKRQQASHDPAPIGQKPGSPPMTFGYLTGYLAQRKAEISQLENLQHSSKAGTGLVPQPA